MSFLSRLFGGPQFSSADEIKEQLEAGALILDVRTEQEFAQGKIKNAVNIPVQVLGQYTSDVKKLNKLVVVYCRSGVRAGTATKILNNAGLEAYNAGGLSDLQALM